MENLLKTQNCPDQSLYLVSNDDPSSTAVPHRIEYAIHSATVKPELRERG